MLQANVWIEQYQLLKIDLPLGKNLPHRIPETLLVGHRFEMLHLQPRLRPAAFRPAKRHIQPVERGTRHQADNAPRRLSAQRVKLFNVFFHR